MSSNHLTLPRHPLMNASGLSSDVDRRDALENTASVLNLLSDLFGSEADDFTALESAHARRGAWILLDGIADTLRAVSRSMARPEPEEVP